MVSGGTFPVSFAYVRGGSANGDSVYIISGSLWRRFRTFLESTTVKRTNKAVHQLSRDLPNHLASDAVGKF